MMHNNHGKNNFIKYLLSINSTPYDQVFVTKWDNDSNNVRFMAQIAGKHMVYDQTTENIMSCMNWTPTIKKIQSCIQTIKTLESSKKKQQLLSILVEMETSLNKTTNNKTTTTTNETITGTITSNNNKTITSTNNNTNETTTSTNNTTITSTNNKTITGTNNTTITSTNNKTITSTNNNIKETTITAPQ